MQSSAETTADISVCVAEDETVQALLKASRPDDKQQEHGDK